MNKLLEQSKIKYEESKKICKTELGEKEQMVVDLFCRLIGEEYLDCVELETFLDLVELKIKDSTYRIRGVVSDANDFPKLLLIDTIVRSSGRSIYMYEIGEVKNIEDLYRLAKKWRELNGNRVGI